jgi:hypothetical protein
MFMSTKRFAPALLVALAVFGVRSATADEMSTYVIAAASGYGVEDCLGEGGECGQVVADAWCEAHGRGVALKFGRSDSPADGVAGRPYFITCGN